MWMIQSALLEMTRKTISLEVQTQAWTRGLFFLSAPESQDLQLNHITTSSQTSLEKCLMLVRKIDPSDWKNERRHKNKHGDPAKIIFWAFLWPIFHWISWHTWLSGPSWSLRHISWDGHHGHLVNGTVPGGRSSSPSCWTTTAVFGMSRPWLTSAFPNNSPFPPAAIFWTNTMEILQLK